MSIEIWGFVVQEVKLDVEWNICVFFVVIVSINLICELLELLCVVFLRKKEKIFLVQGDLIVFGYLKVLDVVVEVMVVVIKSYMFNGYIYLVGFYEC